MVLYSPEAPGWSSASAWKPDDGLEWRCRDEPWRGQPPIKVRGWVEAYLRSFREEQNRRHLGLLSVEDRPSLTLKQRGEAYLDHRQKVEKVARATWFNDQGAIRLLQEWFGADAVPEEITQREMKEKFDGYLRAGAAPSTCKQRRIAMSGFYTWLGAAVNPTADIKFREPKSEKKHGWTTEQLKDVRGAADQVDRTEDYCIGARYTLELALATGLREGEIFAVQGERFNGENHTYRVAEQVSKYARGLTPTKGRDLRTTIVLPEYWPFHPAGKTGLLLTDRRGGLIIRSRERDILKRIMTVAGVKEHYQGSHQTRHTFSRLFLEDYEGDLRDLQKFLGHRSLTTTERFYAHYSVDIAVERANRKLYGERPRVRSARRA